jgi:DNA-binding NarL/FixJ family response regulator
MPQCLPGALWRCAVADATVRAMSDDRQIGARVLLAHLDPMVRVGLACALAEEGIHVLGEERDEDALVLTAGRALPDAIVLGSDDDGAAELGARLRAAVPGAKLIMLPRDESGSEVLDPWSRTPRAMRSPVSEALLSELAASRPNPKE